MNLFSIIAFLLTATTLFSYLNYRHFHLPRAIGIMLISLIISILIIASDVLGFSFAQHAHDIVSHINFSQAFLQGILSFMLFASALQINFLDLKKECYVIGSLASIGVILSTIIVGFGMHFILQLIGLQLPLLYCLAFGALISSTDAIAAIAMLKGANIPRRISTDIAGEALFNDGIAVVLFFIFVTLAGEHANPTSLDIALKLFQTVIGGGLMGVALGMIGVYLANRVDDIHIEVLITLALASGGYSFAYWIDVSAPIAVVVAALWFGHRRLITDPESRKHKQLSFFWELMEEILNSMLFVFIGFYLLALPLDWMEFLAGAIAVGVTLAARFVSIWPVVTALRLRRTMPKNLTMMLTWGGIRGGISLALALTLPPGEMREIIVSMTYVIVAFSILVQGMTIRHVIKEKPHTE
jgi:Na+:H+ antiporter